MINLNPPLLAFCTIFVMDKVKHFHECYKNSVIPYFKQVKWLTQKLHLGLILKCFSVQIHPWQIFKVFLWEKKQSILRFWQAHSSNLLHSFFEKRSARAQNTFGSSVRISWCDGKTETSLGLVAALKSLEKPPFPSFTRNNCAVLQWRI